MARPTLFANRKFLKLATRLQSEALALGHLEFIWHAANETGNPILGDADDVETVARWRGARGELVAALMECGSAGGSGFLERREDGRHEIHDYWHHAPDYASDRRGRENERRREKVCATCHEPYFSTDPRSEYCSAACRHRAYRDRKRDGSPSHGDGNSDTSPSHVRVSPSREGEKSTEKGGLCNGQGAHRGTDGPQDVTDVETQPRQTSVSRDGCQRNETNLRQNETDLHGTPAPAPAPLNKRAPKRDISSQPEGEGVAGERTATQEDHDRKIVSPKKSPRRAGGSRKNGTFEGINNAVEKVLTARLCKLTDIDGIAKVAGITPAQARESVRQLKDRKRVP